MLSSHVPTHNHDAAPPWAVGHPAAQSHHHADAYFGGGGGEAARREHARAAHDVPQLARGVRAQVQERHSQVRRPRRRGEAKIENPRKYASTLGTNRRSSLVPSPSRPSHFVPFRSVPFSSVPFPSSPFPPLPFPSLPCTVPCRVTSRTALATRLTCSSSPALLLNYFPNPLRPPPSSRPAPFRPPPPFSPPPPRRPPRPPRAAQGPGVPRAVPQDVRQLRRGPPGVQQGFLGRDPRRHQRKLPATSSNALSTLFSRFKRHPMTWTSRHCSPRHQPAY